MKKLLFSLLSLLMVCGLAWTGSSAVAATAADGEPVSLTIYPQQLNESETAEYLYSVQVTCLKKGAAESEAVTTTTGAEGDPRAVFDNCDPASTYVVTLHKEGYKDTVVETQAGEEVHGMMYGRTLYIVMKKAESEPVANGVIVSGDVTVKDYRGMLKNATATLSSGNTEFATVSLVADMSRDCYTYQFTEVPSGTYTLGITATGRNTVNYQYDLTYKKEVTVVVGSENVEQNVELELYVDEEEELTVKLWIDPRFDNPSGDPRLFGVTGTCKKKGAEGEGETITGATDVSGDWRLGFTCDTIGLYEITLHKEGFKDTTFETISWEEAHGAIVGRSLTVVMKDASAVESEMVTLVGKVSLGTHTDITLSEKLHLVCKNEDGTTKTLTSDIQDGKYAFTGVPKNAYDSISVVRMAYVNYQSVPVSSALLKVKSPANGVLDLSSATPANDTVTCNIELERIGFSVKGNVKNASNGSGLAGVTVKLGELTVQTSNYGYMINPGDFTFDVVNETQLSFEFSKAGFATVTKDTTISMDEVGVDGVVELAPVAMAPQEQEYTLVGKAGIKPSTLLKGVVVELWSSQFTGSGYIKKDKLGADTTDAEGAWSLKYTGFADDMVYLVAQHADIETEELYRPISNLLEMSPIVIYGSPRMYGMVNCRAAQDVEAATPTVNLTWEWPKALVDGYVDETGQGTYEITMVSIFRTLHRADEDYTVKVCDTVTVANTLPLNSFVDAGTRYPLYKDSTYTYYFTVQYSGKPDYKTIEITDSANLTVKIASKPSVVTPDSVILTLKVNDAKMGKVEGEGKFEKNTEVTIKATANEGYVFVAWVSGNDTVAKTAEYKFTLVSDSTLTAVFNEKTIIANESREQAAWNVYAEGQTIVLQSNAACQYDVYNLAGALVKRAKTNANEYRIAVNNSGLYIIRRISATGISVKKVMVR